jgi:anti-anti-sigma factor
MKRTKSQHNSTTITCAPLSSGERCQEIREGLRQAIAAGSTDLVLDLQGANEISPSGIYLLLAARHSLQGKGGGITLVNPGEEIRRHCALLRLDAMLDLQTIDDQD